MEPTSSSAVEFMLHVFILVEEDFAVALHSLIKDTRPFNCLISLLWPTKRHQAQCTAYPLPVQCDGAKRPQKESSLNIHTIPNVVTQNLDHE